MIARVLTIVFACSLSLLAYAADGDPKVGSDIGIRIMGTIISKKIDRNVVLIKDNVGGKVSAHRIGDLIRDKYQIIEIKQKFLKVIDTKTKKQMLVYQEKFASEAIAARSPSTKSAPMSDTFSEEGFQRKGKEINMTASYRDKLVKQDLAKILMQATAQPHLEDGTITGFALSQIDEGSIYWKSGLKDGDVITSINGIALTSVSGAIKLLHTLKNSDNIEVDFKRGGSEQRLKLTVE